MNKVFIDTNIFIYFLDENESIKKQNCEKLFKAIESGKIKPYSSNIVFMELIYVLVKTFKQSKKIASQILTKLSQMRNFTLIEKTDSKKALLYFSKHSIKFGDCLIATQIPPKSILITHDKEFKKFSSINSMTPEEFFLNS
jgi:predicted nucleic acid-binding protein